MASNRILNCLLPAASTVMVSPSETPTTLPVNVAAWAVKTASKRRMGFILVT